MAKLADALALGASERNLMGVQVPPPAPESNYAFIIESQVKRLIPSAWLSFLLLNPYLYVEIDSKYSYHIDRILTAHSCGR